MFPFYHNMISNFLYDNIKYKYHAEKYRHFFHCPLWQNINKENCQLESNGGRDGAKEKNRAHAQTDGQSDSWRSFSSKKSCEQTPADHRVVSRHKPYMNTTTFIITSQYTPG